MYNFQTVYNLIGAIIALYVGIVGVFFNKWATEFNARGFEWMYRKTKWPIFKLQAEGTRKLPMRAFLFIIGAVSLVIGITTLLSNIYL